MLDTVGIHLKEINGKFPSMFQSLNYDPLLDTDSMGKPKIASSFQLAVNSVLMLLYMKPGQFPSIPELGIDIESYLFEYADDESTPVEVYNKLMDQCNLLGIVGINIECRFDTMDNGNRALLVDITGTDRLCYGNETGHVIIGISYDKLNRLYVRRINVK